MPDTTFCHTGWLSMLDFLSRNFGSPVKEASSAEVQSVRLFVYINLSLRAPLTKTLGDTAPPAEEALLVRYPSQRWQSKNRHCDHGLLE